MKQPTLDVAALGRTLQAFIYPPHCILCDQLIDTAAQCVESAVPRCGTCEVCIATILEQSVARCPRCTAPSKSKESADDVAGARDRHGAEARVKAEAGGGAEVTDAAQVIDGAGGCPTCSSWPPDCAFRRGVALGAFEGPLREAVHALKFNGNRKLGRQVGNWIGSDSMMPLLDALVAVPLHPSRQRERGYNQAELIARGVADTTNTTLIPRASTRTRATTQQALAVSAEERTANLRGAFAVRALELEVIPQSGVVGLVDDVLTTGATLDACGRAILHVRPDLQLVAVVAAIALRDVDPDGPGWPLTPADPVYSSKSITS